MTAKAEFDARPPHGFRAIETGTLKIIRAVPDVRAKMNQRSARAAGETTTVRLRIQ